MKRQKFNNLPCKVFYKLCGRKHVKGYATMQEAENFKKILEEADGLFTDIEIKLVIV